MRLRAGFASGRGLLPGSSRFVGQGGRRSRGRGSHRAADGVILPARKRGSLRLFREPPADAASFNVAPDRRFARFAIKPEPSREPLVCKSVAFSRPASDAAISVFMGGRAHHRTAAPTAPEEERPTGAQPRPPIRLRQAAKGMIDTVPARAMTCRCRAGGWKQAKRKGPEAAPRSLDEALAAPTRRYALRRARFTPEGRPE